MKAQRTARSWKPAEGRTHLGICVGWFGWSFISFLTISKNFQYTSQKKIEQDKRLGLRGSRLILKRDGEVPLRLSVVITFHHKDRLSLRQMYLWVFVRNFSWKNELPRGASTNKPSSTRCSLTHRTNFALTSKARENPFGRACDIYFVSNHMEQSRLK